MASQIIDPSSWWAQWEAEICLLIPQPGRRGSVASMVVREGVLWILTESGDEYSVHRIDDDGFELRLERAG